MTRVQGMFFVLLLFVSSTLLAQEGYTVGENIVKNPSFEEVVNGKAVGWGYSARTYSLCSDTASDGKNSIRFDNQVVSRYDFCNQPLDLKAGEMYQYSCRIKTEKVRCPGQGVTICIQWNGANGKWLGGAFAATGVKGTSKGWVEVSGLTRPIPEEAKKITLSVYGRQETVGTAWIDDVQVKRFIPPFFGPMTTNCYRQQTTGGKVSVFVAVNPLIKDNFSQYKFSLAVIDKAGKDFMTLSPSSHDGHSLVFSLDADKLACGDWRLECRAVNPGSNKNETTSLKMTKVDQLPQRKAWIDEHRRLILDGKPFFPLGLYCGKMSPEHLEIYAKSSYNCIMPYAPISREDLDRLQAKNVKVIYSVKDLYKGARKLETEAEADAKVRETVNALKDHPAIMAWYVNDEYPLSRITELTNRRDLMEELDPGRPTWAVLYQVHELRGYLATCDVVGTDPYPVATKPISLAWEWSVLTNNAVFNAKAVWQVPQIFDWGLYRKTKAAKSVERAPTYEEMRAMYWMNIAGGANGLISYCWHALFMMDKEPSDNERSPAIRKPFEQSWKEVSQIGQEVSDRIPLLLSIDKPMSIKITQGKGSVAHRVYGQGDETWVLLVNLNEKESTDVTLSAEQSTEVIGTHLGIAPVKTPTVDASGKNISVRLAPMEPLFV
ncbi:MAG: hypothetical protein Q4G59_07710, partial [Planctomycetia bacterium]|nr:hypothetical protein [Planctomycetia bacterium]